MGVCRHRTGHAQRLGGLFSCPEAGGCTLDIPSRPTLTGLGGTCTCVGRLENAGDVRAQVLVVVFADAWRDGPKHTELGSGAGDCTGISEMEWVSWIGALK